MRVHAKSFLRVTLFSMTVAYPVFCAKAVKSQEASIGLIMELVPLSTRIQVGENLEFKVRITNANDRKVIIKYMPPYSLIGMEVRSGDRYVECGSYASEPSITCHQKMVLDAHDTQEGYGLSDNFLWDFDHWPMEAGIYEVRMHPFITWATLDQNDRLLNVEWSTPAASIEVLPLDDHHRAAREYLKNELSHSHGKRGSIETVLLEEIAVYSAFLERFAPSAYDREIRYWLAHHTNYLLTLQRYVS